MLIWRCGAFTSRSPSDVQSVKRRLIVFLLTVQGVLEHITVNNFPVGRNVDEALRTLQARITAGTLGTVGWIWHGGDAQWGLSGCCKHVQGRGAAHTAGSLCVPG